MSFSYDWALNTKCIPFLTEMDENMAFQCSQGQSFKALKDMTEVDAINAFLETVCKLWQNSARKPS